MPATARPDLGSSITVESQSLVLLARFFLHLALLLQGISAGGSAELTAELHDDASKPL